MKRKIYLSLIACLSFTLAWSQNRQVSGRVISDTSLAPLSGVTVTVKGTNTMTTTNGEGRYSISVPDRPNVVLVFSSIGYTRRELSLGSGNTLDVALREESGALNDVVVIGYGTARKRDLTGATSSIAARDLEKIPVSSAAEAITGRLAGVQVTTSDGQPGAEIVIRVRGGGSVTQDNSPLYIVDGFPVNSMNDIAPTDIASIDILKDASSTAIYGARGANGVVIITTKSARAGKTTVSLNSFLQARTLPKKLKVLSPYEFVLAQYEYAKIRGQQDLDNFTKFYGVYDDLELYKYQAGTDWQEELFGNTRVSQQHNLSITGGTEKTKMSFSITNNKDEGLQPGSAYNRTYFNYKLNHELFSGLRLDLNSRYTNTRVDGAGTSGGSSVRVGDGITTRPVNGIADQIIFDPNAATDEEYEQFIKGLVSPLALTEQDYRRSVTNTFNMNAAVSWNVVKSLLFRSEFGLDLSWNNNKRYYGPLTGESRTNGNSLPLGEIRNSRSNKYRLVNTLTYSLRTGDHDLNVMGGQELIAGKIARDFMRAENFEANVPPEKLFANMALGIIDRTETFEAPAENLASFFGRVNYQFKDRYLFTFTSRFDGSLKFAPERQWGFFPAAAFAWRVSQEDFMKDVQFVSDVKLRLSYGAVGNNRIGSEGIDLWRRSYTIQTNRPIGFGDINHQYWGNASTIMVNPDITWETTITRNAGLDFTLWRGRLTGALDIYHNTTKDLLVLGDVPAYTGYTQQIRNVGQTSNRGVEITLNGAVVNNRDLRLNASFNVGFNRGTIDKLDGVDERAFNSNWAGTDLRFIDDYRAIVGQSIGLMYGYVTDGFYTIDDFESYDPVTRRYKLKAGVADAGGVLGVIGGAHSAAGFVRPGALKFKNLTGDSLITADDRTIIGNAQPDFQGGFGLNAEYKNFDFNAFFEFTVGNDVYNTGRVAFNMLYRTTFGNMLNTMNYDDRFKYIDANGELVTDLVELGKLNANATMWSPFSSGTASPVFHSYAVEDGSYLRLSNISLGYSLPKSLISKVGMSRARLYFTVYNAFLWTNYSGYDPVVSSTRNGYNALTPGVDFSGYPKSRNYTAGINITF